MGRSSFQRIFNPTPDELQEQYNAINKAIQFSLDKNGPSCSTCAHKKYVQESPFYDYLTCELHPDLENPQGKDVFPCDDYVFCGFLSVKKETE